MRYLAFYYAIGFAIVGCVMLCIFISAFIETVVNDYASYSTAALAASLLLPFAISALSWREWKKVQMKNEKQLEETMPERVLWKGRPWILPDLVGRGAVTIVIAIVIIWLEFSTGIATKAILDVQVILWTALGIFLVLVFSLMGLLGTKFSNSYVLRRDGLEIRSGVFASRTFVISPAGFSDLEVIKSISARIVNVGNIIIRTQGERDVLMVRVRDPLKVADKIREVLARPLVRIEGQRRLLEDTSR